jgi:tetratricopeptide (TPR) repeat protein
MVEVTPSPAETAAAAPSPSPSVAKVLPSPKASANMASSKSLTTDASKSLEDGNYEDAMKNLNKAIKLDENNSRAYILRGRAHFEMQRYEEASQDIENALKIDPNNAYAYYYRGILRAKENEPGAVLDFDEALKLDPKNADAFYRRGLLHLHYGHNDKAKEDFKMTVKLDPTSETGKLAKESLDELKQNSGR